MSEEITVTIDSQGKVTIEAEGFAGSSCTDATAQLEEALGVNPERSFKPEYEEEAEEAGGTW